jgi:adenylate cyclase
MSVSQERPGLQCVICGTPLSGPFSYLFRAVGISRSAGNPNVCSRCFMHVEEERLVEITVLFADLSSFTELTHALGADQTHAVVDRFLKMATDELVKEDAFIDKYIGDAVMAIFNVPIRRPDHAARAVNSAEAIQAGMSLLSAQCGRELKAAIGIASGWARVGRLGSADRKDYTAIGNAVNLAGRLQEEARSGEVLLDHTVYEAVASRHPGVPPENLLLKGFPAPVAAYRLHGTTEVPPRSRPVKHQKAQGLSIGSVIFALLGAPCVALTLLGPLAVAVGIGSVFAASSALWVFDSATVRLPLLGLAAVGTSANLYTAWRAKAAQGATLSERERSTLGFFVRQRTPFVVGASLLTFIVIGLELYLHTLYH